jgi:DNA polymerase-3 subunit epsilon
MTPRRYAFVDLETCGVSPSDDRVTEVGIILVDGDQLIDEWSSLVNPERLIPPEIQSLTGITQAMVKDAPRFETLLPEIAARLQGRIFVAHNARFDYGFIKAEFRRAGQSFTADVLCTVRLSRRLFPQHSSHRLDALVSRHRLEATDRHRAMGDARLIHQFLQTLWRKDPDSVEAAIRELLKQPATPPNIAPGSLDALPESPGVYTFLGPGGQALYIGKAKNLRERVRAHFYADSRNANDARLASEVHVIEHRLCAGEFSALLHEMHAIKAFAPLHNIALRKRDTLCFLNPDTPGKTPRFLSLAQAQESHSLQALYGPFGSKASARAALAALGREHRLCDAALGLPRREGACFSHQVKRCAGLCVGAEPASDHHQRLLEAMQPMRFPAWPFDGPVSLTEHDPESGLTERHRFDQWRALSEEGLQPFDPDVYKLLKRTLSRSAHRFVPESD